MTCKVLYVTTSSKKVFGGGKRTFFNLIVRLDKKQFKPIVVCARDSYYSDLLKNEGVKTYEMDMENRYNLHNILLIFNVIKRESIQIVHSQGGVRTDFYALLAAKFAGANLAVTSVAVLAENYNVNRIQKIIYKSVDHMIKKGYQLYLPVSENLKYKLNNSYRIPKERIVRIYNGIDIERFKPTHINCNKKSIREEYQLENNTFIIGSIGRMVWEKGFKYLIRAIPEVLSNYPNSTFLFVGDGPEKFALLKIVESLNIQKNVIFTGFRQNVEKILSEIDLLVIPSLIEGFPMITLEAMAMEKPIIASNIGGIPEQIINNESGVLVRSKNSQQLSKAILRLISDQNLSLSIGKAARKRVRSEFSIEKMVFKTEKIYRALVQNNAK